MVAKLSIHYYILNKVCYYHQNIFLFLFVFAEKYKIEYICIHIYRKHNCLFSRKIIPSNIFVFIFALQITFLSKIFKLNILVFGSSKVSSSLQGSYAIVSSVMSTVYLCYSTTLALSCSVQLHLIHETNQLIFINNEKEIKLPN